MMNCTEFAALLPRLADLEPGSDELLALERHAAGCPACAKALSAERALSDTLRGLDDDAALPEAFTRGWRASIRQETPKRKGFKRWQAGLAAVAAVWLFVGGAALVRSGIMNRADENAPYAAKRAGGAELVYDGAPAATPAPSVARAMYDADEMVEMEEMAGATDDAGANSAVILQSANLSLKTGAYDVDIARIQALLSEAGGRAEYESTSGEALAENPESGRRTHMTLRVGADKLESFLEALMEIGKTTRVERVSEDVSADYYDAAARADMYAAQRDRLIELMAQAETVEDLIALEDRASELQYRIESLTGSLKHWDSLARDAVVNLTVIEVEAGADSTAFGARLVSALRTSARAVADFFSGLVVALAAITPWLPIVSIAGVLIYLAVRIVLRIRKKKRS